MSFILICLASCGHPSKQETKLPLVLSISVDGGFNEYLDLTDSLLYAARLIRTDNEEFGLMLRRFRLTDSGSCDTQVFPCPYKDSSDWFFYPGLRLEVDLYASGRCFDRLPHRGWKLFPVPLGDTSNMLCRGEVKSFVHDYVSQESFQSTLRRRWEHFYIIDMHSAIPRTVACIEGMVVDFADPYLLLLSGYGYTEQSNREVDPTPRYVKGCELILIDMRDMHEIGRLPVTLESDAWEIWYRACLTPDHKLLYTEIVEWPECWLYFPGIDKLVSEEEAWASAWYRFLTDSQMLRYYRLERRSVLTWDIDSGDVSRSELLLPFFAFSPYTGKCLDNKGRAIFISEPQGWGFHMFEYNPWLVQVPAVSDLTNPPREISELRKFKKPGWEMNWELSPDKRWLVLDCHKQFSRLRKWLSKRLPPYDHILVPTEALSDPSLLKSVKSCVNIPQYQSAAPFRFAPGEDWVLTGNRPGAVPLLYACGQGNPPIPLLSSNETDFQEAFFSPDGGYVGYICRLEGENFYRLQVRQLPPYPSGVEPTP
ncbi:hypothetical protein ES703_10777 [subsurface metagenome]